MRYEDLKNYAEDQGLRVVEKDFKSKRLNGLCKGKIIGIKRELPTVAKKCVLAEEMGHVYTTYGNILDQRNANNMKQEYRAKVWAYEKLVPIENIRFALMDGYNQYYDMADYLDVSIEFLIEAVEYYRSKGLI